MQIYFTSNQTMNEGQSVPMTEYGEKETRRFELLSGDYTNLSTNEVLAAWTAITQLQQLGDDQLKKHTGNPESILLREVQEFMSIKSTVKLAVLKETETTYHRTSSWLVFYDDKFCVLVEDEEVNYSIFAFKRVNKLEFDEELAPDDVVLNCDEEQKVLAARDWVSLADQLHSLTGGQMEGATWFAYNVYNEEWYWKDVSCTSRIWWC